MIPGGMVLAEEIMPAVEIAHSSNDAVKDSDAVVIATEWDAFCALDLKKLAKVMKGSVFVDLPNIYNPSEVGQTSLKYMRMGDSGDC